MKIFVKLGFAGALMAACLAPAKAAEITVLTTGAFKPIVLAMVPDFEKQTGHKVTVQNETAGAVKKMIEAGAPFDLAVITPALITDLTKQGKIVDGTKTDLARVGVGVMVRDGAPKPDISTVDAFKKALLAAKTVAYIDPASGGSSGIYFDKLLEKLGVASEVRAKAKLKKGGYVADLLVSGEAELGVHQISEIVPVKGVTLVGPLPAEIQNYTTYTAGIGAASANKDAAAILMKVFSSPAALALYKSKGMDPAN